MNTKSQEYLGWQNYQTWLVNLWLTNEYEDYQHWMTRIEQLLKVMDDKQKAINLLALDLQEAVFLNAPKGVTDLYADLLVFAINSVC